MRLSQLNSIALTLLVAFGLWGCLPQQAGKDKALMNLAEVAATIKKPAALPTVLEADTSQQPSQSEPTKKLMVSQQGGDNPLLQVPARKKVTTPEAYEGEGILLNFDNADIYEVIQSIAELLDMNYIIDPQVKGTVNIRSGKKIPMDQLFTVFRKILHINGLDVRNEGEYQYFYVAKSHGADKIRGPEQIVKLKESPEMLMQIVPVMHLASGEAMKLIQPYLSDHGQVFDLPNQNMLIITDFESKILDCVTILSRLDVSPLASLKVMLHKVKNAPLFDLKDELDEILRTMKVESKEGNGVSIMALERINSLMLVSNSSFLLETVERWIKELDVMPSEGRDNIYIYNVRNSVASELSDLVSQLIADNGGSGRRQTNSQPRTTPRQGKTGQKTAARTKTASRPKTMGGKTSSAMQFAGEPILIADDSRNVILIRALPPDYSRIQKLLARLDNMPRQVLIEVMVAEMTLGENWHMGLEWYLKNQQISYNGHRGLSNIISDNNTSDGTPGLSDVLGGFTYSFINQNENIFGLLNMLASDNRLSVLSSPQVLVLNNETATVNVGDQVPIITSESGSSTAGDLNRTIQYKDTGIILNVTPRINYDGIILIDIDQQVSTVNNQIVTDVSSPTISTKQVKTKLAVKDGQSILIGGLISRDKTDSENGVPGFKDVPLLGYLFKYQEKVDSRKELLITITPYVIESENVLDQYVREFQKRTSKLRENIFTTKGISFER